MIIISHKQISAVFNRSVGADRASEPRGMVSRRAAPPPACPQAPPLSRAGQRTQIIAALILFANTKVMEMSTITVRRRSSNRGHPGVAYEPVHFFFTAAKSSEEIYPSHAPGSRSPTRGERFEKPLKA
ncbi:hypothetical protein EVAR_27511_1 [Eumeta japonica]|uniref:Uncharacterized protein n=1 Tax=Eumeta variegata TaxID=151549 RepID=A0A4C1XGQ1_EUMVA|nr:hypothetical protein EVAR_27511_1 [Eumeta japonica]